MRRSYSSPCKPIWVTCSFRPPNELVTVACVYGYGFVPCSLNNISLSFHVITLNFHPRGHHYLWAPFLIESVMDNHCVNRNMPIETVENVVSCSMNKKSTLRNIYFYCLQNFSENLIKFNAECPNCLCCQSHSYKNYGTLITMLVTKLLIII